MRKLPKIKIYKIKEFLGKYSRILASHSFFALSTLFLLAIVIGGFIYYNYGFPSVELGLGNIKHFPQFKETLYREIQQEKQDRQKRFNEAGLKEYINPFESRVIVEEPVFEEGSGEENGLE